MLKICISCVDKIENVNTCSKFIDESQWIEKEYYNEIIKNNSPAKSYKKVSSEFILQFPNSCYEQGNCNVGYSLNNHEGSNFNLEFKKGIKGGYITNIVDYNCGNCYFELNFEIKNKDTVFYLSKYDVLGKLIQKKDYVKLNHEFETFINLNTVVGKFNFCNKEFVFEPEGKLKCLNKIYNYEILTDFMTAEEINYDILCIDDNCYNVEISENFIKIIEKDMLIQNLNLLNKNDNCVINDSIMYRSSKGF